MASPKDHPKSRFVSLESAMFIPKASAPANTPFIRSCATSSIVSSTPSFTDRFRITLNVDNAFLAPAFLPPSTADFATVKSFGVPDALDFTNEVHPFFTPFFIRIKRFAASSWETFTKSLIFFPVSASARRAILSLE
jgi:hypothetical protein